MSHANARLTFLGRCLLVRRIRVQQRPVAHVAKEMGVSRQCAHRWVARFDAEGWAGLHHRSSRPESCPRATPAADVQAVLAHRDRHRCGRDEIAAAPVSRPDGVSDSGSAWSACADRLDPVTGTPIRAPAAPRRRYERGTAGDLLHLDVKKIGRIPDGGGWRVHGRAASCADKSTNAPRSASTTCTPPSMTTRGWPTPKSTPMRRARAPGSLPAPRAWFATVGITVMNEVITDNAFAYRHSRRSVKRRQLWASPRQLFIKPHCPWQNGKVERFNRTCKPSGPTDRSSPATPTEPPPSTPGSSATTLNDATPPSEDQPPISRAPSPT